MRWPAALPLFGLALIWSAAAEAQVPPDFRRTQVFVQPTVSARHFVGPLGEPSSWGIGMGLTQGAQFGYVGVNVTLDTDYFLSDQQPPPFNGGFQISGLDISVRGVYPLRDFRPFVELGYRRVGFISNALVELTGSQLAYNGMASALGLRLVQLSPLYFEVQTTIDWLPSLDNSYLLGTSFAIGIRSLL